MKVLIFTFHIIFFIQINESKDIPYCSEQSERIQLCKNNLEHSPNRPPKPYPVLVNATIDLKDVLNVDADMETITVFAKIVLMWHDFGISVITPNNTK